MTTAELTTPRRLLADEFEERVRELLSGEQTYMKEAIDLLLTQATLYRASDIHIEPYRADLRIRMRVDGWFRDVVLLPGSLQEQIVSRVKVMAGLVVHRRDVPQEGRIRIGRADFRISIIPTVSGEKLAIRIFDTAGRVLEIEDLGFLPETRERFEAVLLRLSGTVLLTGPAGTGKTTTLYAALRRIHDRCGDHAAITTIEDPVEYDLGLFAQMEVKKRSELTFAGALTAVLRQDPQVIMLGEVRDPATCEIAMRAGLTGHLVLSTIHSGTAAGVVTRLIDMGIEPFVITSSLRAVIAQRLVRAVCPDCREEYDPDAGILAVASRAGIESDRPFTRGRGCETCVGLGYSGRLALTELLEVDEGLTDIIAQKAGTAGIHSAALSGGFTPLLADGVAKAVAGHTTLEEVVRVLGVERMS
jgi:type II secretory ATPase GspE/PulE/Tfp pilus assembly ATPase PilB-like protein